MIFNKSDNGAEELQELTGSYYANNEFTKIKTDIRLESENLVELIGEDIFDLAETHYLSDDYLQPVESGETGSSADTAAALERQRLDDLVHHIQLPIALIATYNHYQANIVSHEDGGRKVKVNGTEEKMPWEWMLDRDDEANLRKAYKAIDRLIRFLDKGYFDAWNNSDARSALKTLFVANTKAFQDIYPIDNSPRFFYTIAPFMAEIQRNKIKPAVGAEKYEELLYALSLSDVPQSGGDVTLSGVEGSSPGIDIDVDDALLELLSLVRAAIPLLTMVVAVKRLSLQVLPEGVVQQFKSMMQTRSASQAVLPEVVKIFLRDLQADADKALDDIKKYLKSQEPVEEYVLIPENDPDSKVFRT